MCTGDDGERKNEMEVRKKKRLLRMQRISGARKKERTKLKKQKVGKMTKEISINT